MPPLVCCCFCGKIVKTTGGAVAQRRSFRDSTDIMLDRDFAEKFIDRVTRYADFNVNIVDERGIIIASREKTRIGQ